MRATSIIYRRELGATCGHRSRWVIAAVLLLAHGILFQALRDARRAALRDRARALLLLRERRRRCSPACSSSFRLIAEERQNHSMVLLNTSPVRDYEIVLGKFFAALTFLAIMLALSLYMPLLIKVNGKITGAQILVGYLGLFLLGAVSARDRHLRAAR